MGGLPAIVADQAARIEQHKLEKPSRRRAEQSERRKSRYSNTARLTHRITRFVNALAHPRNGGEKHLGLHLHSRWARSPDEL
jgi:hypothetical protein